MKTYVASTQKLKEVEYSPGHEDVMVLCRGSHHAEQSVGDLLSESGDGISISESQDCAKLE